MQIYLSKGLLVEFPINLYMEFIVVPFKLLFKPRKDFYYLVQIWHKLLLHKRLVCRFSKPRVDEEFRFKAKKMCSRSKFVPSRTEYGHTKK